MGNENSSLQTKISKRILGKQGSPEIEINIGSPTNVVHLDKSEVLKLIEKHQSYLKEENPQKEINKCDKESTQTLVPKSIEEPCETRKSSKETFQSYVKKSSVKENVEITNPGKISLKSDNTSTNLNEELDIGQPTNVTHVGGLEVLQLVEKQVKNSFDQITDAQLTKRIEEAKELPKMFFQPDAFNETQSDMFNNKMKSILSAGPEIDQEIDESYLTETKESVLGDESPCSVSFVSDSETDISSHLNIAQRIHEASEAVKKAKHLKQKSEILELAKLLHEGLDVLLTSYLDSIEEN